MMACALLLNANGGFMQFQKSFLFFTMTILLSQNSLAQRTVFIQPEGAPLIKQFSEYKNKLDKAMAAVHASVIEEQQIKDANKSYSEVVATQEKGMEAVHQFNRLADIMNYDQLYVDLESVEHLFLNQKAVGSCLVKKVKINHNAQKIIITNDKNDLKNKALEITLTTKSGRDIFFRFYSGDIILKGTINVDPSVQYVKMEGPLRLLARSSRKLVSAEAPQVKSAVSSENVLADDRFLGYYMEISFLEGQADGQNYNLVVTDFAAQGRLASLLPTDHAPIRSFLYETLNIKIFGTPYKIGGSVRLSSCFEDGF